MRLLEARKSEVYDVANIDRFKRLSKQLLNLIDIIPELHENADQYGKYLLLFYQRLQSHLSSVLKLEDLKEGWLIARSALEGAAWIKWMDEDPVNRGELFKELYYRNVYNHALLYRDIGIDLNDQSVFVKLFGKDGKHLLKKIKVNNKKEAKALARREKLKRTQTEILIKESVGDIIEMFVRKEDFYAAFSYGMFSEFQHWSPRTLQGIFIGKRLQYSSRGELFGLLAIESCFVSLYIVSKSVNKYFQLGLERRLDRLYKIFSEFRKRTPGDLNI